MSATRGVSGFAAAAFVLGIAAHSQAFCLTHTCDPKTEQCEVVESSHWFRS